MIAGIPVLPLPRGPYHPSWAILVRNSVVAVDGVVRSGTNGLKSAVKRFRSLRAWPAVRCPDIGDHYRSEESEVGDEL